MVLHDFVWSVDYGKHLWDCAGVMSDIEHARAVRAQRAAILRGLGDGTFSIRATLRDPPTCVLECTLYDLIRAAYNMGPTGAKNVCKASRLSPLTRIGSMKPMTREHVIKKLPRRAQ